MNIKWFFAVAIIPILSMALGVVSWKYTESSHTIVKNTNSTDNAVVSKAQCVIAIEKPSSNEDARPDIMVTSTGILIEENKAGVFVVPCDLDGSEATLHESKTKSLLGRVTLRLNQKSMQVISRYQLR